VRVFGFAGRSGSGKTTLAECVLKLLISRGMTVSVIKHTHHAVDLETPGKDTWRFRAAGASQVLLASAARWVLMQELHGAPEPELPALLATLAPCDLALVEGFRRHAIPRLEVYRAANGTAPMYPDDPHIIAVATDTALPTALPTFGLEDYEGVARFILDRAVELRV
jgi:molybdopterin-guanine dinucleotide biosynthesis protein B